MEHLNKTWVDMSKGAKVASGVWEKAEAMETPSPRVTSASVKVAEVLEKVEVVVAEVAWVIKFKKMKDGTQLTSEGAERLQSRAADLMCEMLDYNKSLKVLLPSVKE